MLDDDRILEIARDIARAQISDSNLERVLSEPTTDSEGNDALHITVVLKPDAVGLISGDTALDVLVNIQRQLQAEGEERLPIVEYATEQELQLGAEEDVDPDENTPSAWPF
jgi:hypothetical protein